jgi:3-oxoacyl-[acyl-carrier protein] reductase
MAITAIVMGGSGGIGRSIARRLASDGLSVVVNYAGNVKDAEETVSEIKSAGGHAVAVAGDVSQANDASYPGVDQAFFAIGAGIIGTKGLR